MFYDRYVQICKEHSVSPSKAAIDAGLSKSTVTKWKNTPDAEPTGTAIKKLCEYFSISVADLLGEDENENSPDKPELTEGEKKLLELFRKIPTDRQYLVIQMIDAALSSL